MTVKLLFDFQILSDLCDNLHRQTACANLECQKLVLLLHTKIWFTNLLKEILH